MITLSVTVYFDATRGKYMQYYCTMESTIIFMKFSAFFTIVHEKFRVL